MMIPKIGEGVHIVDITMQDYIRLNFERALRDGHITITYEPVIRALTGKICALEALARWNDPIQGKISPAVFVPVLEESKKIHLLDHFIMKQAAIDQYHHLQQEILQPPVILNLSRCDFESMDPCRELALLMEKYHLPHAYFQIEVTETALAQDEGIIAEAIRQFRSQGHPVILDNFGKGYSSLAALKKYAIDEISIDRSFFCEFNEDSRKILTALVLMAKSLGIHVAAEGVQNDLQRHFLRDIGCEKLQGPCFKMNSADKKDTTEAGLSALQEELVVESPMEGQIFKQAGLTNLVTDTPVAILLDNGTDFALLSANEAYQQELQKAGIVSRQQLHQLHYFLPPMMREKIRTLANQAIRSRRREEMTCIGEGQYFHFHLQTLAGTNGLYLHRAELRHLLSEKQAKNDSHHYDRIVRNLLHIYQDIYLVDFDKNRIDIVESALADREPGEHLHGIMKSFLVYAANHIYSADRQRFLHFIRDLGQKKYAKDWGRDTISGLFRVRHANGNYLWKTFEVVFFQQKNHPYLLLCLRDFLFENQPDKENLLRNVMASYGFTSPTEDKGSNIGDAQLWRSLMHFSHRKLFWKDTEGRFLGASPAFLRFYGIESSNDLIGRTDDDIGWHISNLHIDQDEHNVITKGIPIHDGHGHCISRGRQHTISYSKYPIYDGLKIVGLLGEFRDLEEQEKQQALQRRLYLIDEETNFYNYRGMILASVEFADNLRLQNENYIGAMLVVPEFDLIAKNYGAHIRKRLLLLLRDIIRQEMPPNVVAARTGSGIFMLFQKNMSLGDMRDRLKEIERRVVRTTEIDGYACTLSLHYALAEGTEARTSDEFLKIISQRCLGTLPAFGVAGLRGDHIAFELEKFDNLNRLIYIADPATYELIYANPCLLRYLRLPANFHYAGKKCYELCGKSNAPCTECPRERLHHDSFLFQKTHSPWTSADYWNWTTLISWNGHDYIFSDGIDIQQLTQESHTEEPTDLQHISVNDAVNLAIREEDPDKGITHMLAKIGQILAAERIILMEEEEDGFHLRCSYDWHKDDVDGIRPSLRRLSILDFKPIYEDFQQTNILLIEDAPAYMHKHPDYIPHVDHLERMAIGHLTINDRSLGYLVILNPSRQYFPLAKVLIQTAMHVCSILLRNRDNLQHLHELSTVDQLTGIGNRRALLNYLQNSLQTGLSYVIIFTDINGLKKTNDTYGHERGDLLIQTVAFVLTEILGRSNVFRLGGDEFLSIVPCENAIGAGNLLRRIEKHLKTHAASAALGYVIRQAPFGDIDDIIHEADANMYRDKQKKHMTREDLL